MDDVRILRNIPDVLTASDGERVQSVEEWERKRRPEVLNLFREYVYGREPVQRPATLHFMEESIDDVDGSTRKKIRITYEGPGGLGDINLLLFVPRHIEKPVPAFLLINNQGPEVATANLSDSSSFWPAKYILSRGYAAAIFQVADLDPDFDDDFQNGVHGIYAHLDEPRPGNAWGTIAAWAWGASRVMDYFETDSDIDSKRVAVVGHSRGGKTALWAGAVDERFAMVVSNDSGCTGAALARGSRGERIKDINTVFPHWFARNYRDFNDREDALPVDQHMLLSLIAPRPLYVASASEDHWADPEWEFMSLTLAEPVYALYGFRGLSKHQFPQPDSLIEGDALSYHLRPGLHALTDYDWKRFIDFADACFL